MSELGQQQTLHRRGGRPLRIRGATTTILPAASPADARLIIAADPICSKLSIRNSSPKPSSRFSSSASTASNVQSRDVMPVPPVAMTTWTSAGGELTLDRAAHERRVVLHDHPADHFVSGGDQQIGDRAAASVRLLGARVADGDDVAAHRGRRQRLVFGVGSRGHHADCNSIANTTTKRRRTRRISFPKACFVRLRGLCVFVVKVNSLCC